MHAMSPGPLKGLSEQEQGTSRAAENRAPRGNSSSAPSQTQLQTAASSQGTGGREDNGVAGTGPGNMPSGISVLELKQMTALRMAHAQGHLGGASSFPYGEPRNREKFDTRLLISPFFFLLSVLVFCIKRQSVVFVVSLCPEATLVCNTSYTS